MRRIQVTLWLKLLAAALLGWVLTQGIEQLDREASARERAQQVEAQFRAAAGRLERTLLLLSRANADMAAEIADDYDLSPARLTLLADRITASFDTVLHVSVVRDLTIVFVHPLAGNEAVRGLDYKLHPDILSGVRKAIDRRETVLGGPFNLVQSDRRGIVVRTPIFRDSGQGSVYWGLVGTVLDLEYALEASGLSGAEAGFRVAIRGRDGSGAQGEVFYGEAAIFRQSHVAVDLAVPGGAWQIAAVPRFDQSQDGLRATLIRTVGALVTLALLVTVLLRHRERGAGQGATTVRPAPPWLRRLSGRIGMRSFLSVAVICVLLPIVAVSGWVSYRNAQQSGEQLTRALAWEISARVRDRVVAFFDVPRRVVAFNVEQARSGLLGQERREHLTTRFLQQIRQQPLLTFVSMGMADGEYFGGSRPPLGTDRSLRVLHATRANDRVMHVYRVDETGIATELVSKGQGRFDSRQRPWFRAAQNNGSMAWYPAYRYAVNDSQGAYETMGIGVSAPVYDARGEFIGVTSADVALSQLNAFLADLTVNNGGAAFIAESSGELLATSTPEPTYRLDVGKATRVHLAASDNPLLRGAGAAIAAARGHNVGGSYFAVGEQRYLVEWEVYQLPQGPRLTIGVILPKARFDALATGMLRNVAYLALAIALFSMTLGVLTSEWVTRPLAALSRTAGRLARGEWDAADMRHSPIREVATLFTAMSDMAVQLRAQTELLEHRVARRTEELETANRRLAELSNTDGLTGLANRRRFDAWYAGECQRARRAGGDLAVLMIDVDLFKAYNDHYGHQAGDDCLIKVARVLQENTRRASDLAARYGGEEFIVVAPDLDADKAREFAHALCRAVAALGLPHAASPHGVVTISVGVAVFAPGRETTPEGALQLADERLYRAKHDGRNRAVSI